MRLEYIDAEGGWSFWLSNCTASFKRFWLHNWVMRESLVLGLKKVLWERDGLFSWVFGEEKE